MARASIEAATKAKQDLLDVATEIGITCITDGAEYQRLTDACNERGLTTAAGKNWTAKNMKGRIRDWGLFKADTPDTQESHDSETPEVLHEEDVSETTTDTPDPIVTQASHGSETTSLDPDTLADLLAMLDWWMALDKAPEQVAQEKDSSVTPKQRPMFLRHPNATKTIRLSKRMIELAEAAAAKEKLLTGGSFSGLVEMLLWEYLGKPDDLIETQ